MHTENIYTIINSMKKAFVTGAAGFIGSRLVNYLLSNSVEVVAFVRYNSRGDIGLLKYIPNLKSELLSIEFGDLRDVTGLLSTMDGCDTVFHLGAVISVPYSYLHPREVVEVNVLGTLSMLEAAVRTEVKRFVQVSSSEVYGSAVYTPMDESHPRHAQSPYAASKTGADELARSFYHTYGLPTTIIRPFNTFGPGQSRRAVISHIIVSAIRHQRVRLGNIWTVRDFTFVDDTVKGIALAATSENAIGAEMNLGTGEGHTIEETAKLVFEILNMEPNIELDSSRMRPKSSEVAKLISDNSLARKLLGWAPEVSFRDGLRATIEWIRGHIDLYTNPEIL